MYLINIGILVRNFPILMNIKLEKVSSVNSLTIEIADKGRPEILNFLLVSD